MSATTFFHLEPRGRLPNTAHTSRPWRVHEIAPDFDVEDVWALKTPGGKDEFGTLVAQFVAGDFPDDASLPVRVVWAVRWRIGQLLGWDGEDTRVGSRVSSLRHRLPEDLRDAPVGPDFGEIPLDSVYQLADEWVAEMSNRTVHTILHMGWVPDADGSYRGQLAVLVKPNGRFGSAYLAAIKPFRLLIVYPALTRLIERDWRRSR